MSAEGSVGVMSPERALAMAEERGLLLVEVSPHASPPVWRLMPRPALDDAPPAESEPPPPQPAAAEPVQLRRPPKPGKKGKPLKVKEVRLSDRCEPRDADTKAANALKFLRKGHVVKVMALNSGRVCDDEGGGGRRSMAEVLVARICADCAELATSGGITGRTSTDRPDGTHAKQALGIVAAVLTPKGSSSK